MVWTVCREGNDTSQAQFSQVTELTSSPVTVCDEMVAFASFTLGALVSAGSIHAGVQSRGKGKGSNYIVFVVKICHPVCSKNSSS